MGSRLVAHKLTDACQLHLGNANDNRDDKADDQDRGNAERVRPHMDEAYDKHEDDPDHRYCGKGDPIRYAAALAVIKSEAPHSATAVSLQQARQQSLRHQPAKQLSLQSACAQPVRLRSIRS
jgi:hypothetical protein